MPQSPPGAESGGRGNYTKGAFLPLRWVGGSRLKSRGGAYCVSAVPVGGLGVAVGMASPPVSAEPVGALGLALLPSVVAMAVGAGPLAGGAVASAALGLGLPLAGDATVSAGLAL